MHKFRLVMGDPGNKISIFIPASRRRLRGVDPLDRNGIALSMRRVVRGKTGLLIRGYQLGIFFLTEKKQGYSVATLATLPSLARALPFDPTPAVGLGSRNE